MFVPKSFLCQLCLILEICDLINIETSSSQTVKNEDSFTLSKIIEDSQRAFV